MRSLIKDILIIASGFAVGLILGHRVCRKPPESQVITKVDTCVVYDTIVREKPVFRYSYIHDTIRTYFTTIEHDTVLVDVPIERKVYAEDSLYRCEISGYRPQLEYLVIYPTTTTITIHDTKTEYRNSRISFGLQAGYGISKSGLSPYLGAGISYNLFSINNLKIK